MQNPDERELDSRLQDTKLDQPLDYREIEPIDPGPAPYVKEPLFNKKVMIAYAVGAFLVWFTVTYVVPAAVSAARVAISESIKEAQNENGGTITIKRNGQTITITRNPPSRGGAAQPATSATPAATAAKPIEPAQPPAPKAPEKTEPAKR